MDALKIDNLYKSFGTHNILNGLSLIFLKKLYLDFWGKMVRVRR